MILWVQPLLLDERGDRYGFLLGHIGRMLDMLFDAGSRLVEHLGAEIGRRKAGLQIGRGP